VSISVKLVVVVTLCLAFSVGGLTLIAMDFFQSESLSQAKRDTAFTTQLISQDLSRELNSQAQKMTSLVHILETNDAAKIKTLPTFLNSQESLLSFAVYKPSPNDTFPELYFAAKRDGLVEFNLQQSSLETSLLPATIKAVLKKPSGLTIVNSSLILKKPIFTLAFFNEKHWLVKSEIRMDVFKDYLKNKEGLTLFVIDHDGIVFGSSNSSAIAQGINISNSGIFTALKESTSSFGQISYTDDQGQPCVGAYNSLNSGISVISQVDVSQLFAPLEHLRYRELLVSFMALGLAWFITILYSARIISGLQYLYGLMVKVAAGHFPTNMEVVSDDEIGGVARGFKKMVMKLQERERLKGTLTKFPSGEETDKILCGETKLATEIRRMTVLHIEIYNFVSNSPNTEETFRQLNAFWNEVARIVKKYLGFIDQNDPQMMRAIWGALGQINDEGSSGLSAALEIRKAIQKFNERRESKNSPHLKYGIGIHTGDVLPGNFGFDERTQYTFAGQDVVMASRVAALNSHFNSDILVSEDTQMLLKNKGFIFGPSITSDDGEFIVRQVIGRKKNDGEVETDLTRAEQDTIKSGVAKAESMVVTSFAQIEQSYNKAENIMPIANSQSHYSFEMTAAGPGGIKSNMIQSPATNGQLSQDSMWYLMRNVQNGIAEGPFNVDDLRRIAEQPGFPIMEAYAYRFNDAMMTPLMQVPNLSRRRTAPPIPPTLAAPSPDLLEKAGEEEWFIQREDGRVYGPYAQNKLLEFLDGGQMTRTTYCWRKGMNAWVYAFQLPGLDRRGSTPPPPPLPIPAKAA
jgi:class 3 adenylate cyclase